MVIYVTGPQGSGKTTQAEKLAQKLNLPFISMGRILRELDKKQNPLGIEAKKNWEKGELVPDELVEKILLEYFQSHSYNQGFVVEGFPRDKSQYGWMKNVFVRPIEVVVELTLEKEEILARLNKRRAIEQRADESPEAIKVRLRTYLEETLPLVSEFRKDGIVVISIDGRGEIEEIHEEIIERLKKKGFIN